MFFYKAISYVFHPIVFSTIASFVYFILLPTYMPDENERTILSIVFVSTYIVPMILLVFLKRFRLIDSYKLHTIAERRFPVLFMILLFFLLGKLLLDIKIVDLLAFSFLGCALALILVYTLFSLKIKSSLHTLSIGGLISFTCILSYHYKINMLFFIALLFILSGFIAVSRLKLNAHKSNELYIGFLIGMVSQLAIYTLVALKYIKN